MLQPPSSRYTSFLVKKKVLSLRRDQALMEENFRRSDLGSYGPSRPPLERSTRALSIGRGRVNVPTQKNEQNPQKGQKWVFSVFFLAQKSNQQGTQQSSHTPFSGFNLVPKWAMPPFSVVVRLGSLNPYKNPQCANQSRRHQRTLNPQSDLLFSF